VELPAAQEECYTELLANYTWVPIGLFLEGFCLKAENNFSSLSSMLKSPSYKGNDGNFTYFNIRDKMLEC
jgi:hypothetical protein